MFDSQRGLHTTSQESIALDFYSVQSTEDWFTTSSTGFGFTTAGSASVPNLNSYNYIYYAHA